MCMIKIVIAVLLCGDFANDAFLCYIVCVCTLVMTDEYMYIQLCCYVNVNVNVYVLFLRKR